MTDLEKDGSPESHENSRTIQPQDIQGPIQNEQSESPKEFKVPTTLALVQQDTVSPIQAKIAESTHDEQISVAEKLNGMKNSILSSKICITLPAKEAKIQKVLRKAGPPPK